MKKGVVQDNRKHDIDFLKGIGIILVVIGHSTTSDIIRNTIYIFHMPLFFMISGLLHKNYENLTIRKYALKKFKDLMYPYYILGALFILYNTIIDIMNGGFIITTFLKRSVALGYGNYIWENNSGYIGTLWFLCALYCVEIIFEIILRAAKRNKKIVSAVTLSITVLGIVLSYAVNYSRRFTMSEAGYRFPYCLDIALVAVVFYGTGYFVKNIKITKNRGILGALLFVAGGMLGWININISNMSADMLYLRWGNPILFLMAAALSSLGLYWISCFVVKEIKNNICFKFIESCGKNSLLIMVIHLYSLPYVTQVLLIVGLNFSWITPIVTLISTWGVSLVIVKWFSWLYKFPRIQSN